MERLAVASFGTMPDVGSDTSVGCNTLRQLHRRLAKGVHSGDSLNSHEDFHGEIRGQHGKARPG